jgi:hypothetical protein
VELIRVDAPGLGLADRAHPLAEAPDPLGLRLELHERCVGCDRVAGAAGAERQRPSVLRVDAILGLDARELQIGNQQVGIALVEADGELLAREADPVQQAPQADQALDPHTDW